MRIEELYRSGITDNEDLGEHARQQAQIQFNVSFAHERGNEELFSQLLAHAQFQAAIEAEFAAVLQRTIQKMVSASSTTPGSGWTDDFEVGVSVSSKEANSI